MDRKGSRFQQFVKRIPAGLTKVLAGRELLVPLGEGVPPARVKFGPATQAVRFSLRTSDPSEVKMKAGSCGRIFRRGLCVSSAGASAVTDKVAGRGPGGGALSIMGRRTASQQSDRLRRGRGKHGADLSF